MQLAALENRISSIDVYRLFGYKEHRNLKEIISKHIDDFNKVGELRVSTVPCGNKGGRPSEVYLLTLGQALLLSGLVKNSSKSNKADILTTLVNAYENSSLTAALEIIKNIDIEDDIADRYVYVAKESESGRYKIGISSNPEKRIKQLNTGNPERLVLVHAYLASESGYKSELLAHKTYEKNRLSGEWFDSSIDISLLPSYAAKCTLSAEKPYCECLDCDNHSKAFDILDGKVGSRDSHIGLLIDRGFEFSDAAKSVDALFDNGVIDIQ
jgi:hypothetical protein